MEFSKKIQELRNKNKLTQEQFAEKLYVSRTAVSKWESGKGYPSIDSLKYISKIFNVSIDELLSNEEIIDIEELSISFIATLKKTHSGLLSDRYEVDEGLSDYEILKAIAIKRNCLLKGAEADTKRAAKLLLDDFKEGKLSRITLEKAEEI